MKNNTHKNPQNIRDDINALSEDARVLLADTAALTGDKVAAVRERLSSALQSAKETCGELQEKAARGVKAADEMVRENPYESVGIAFGVGALVGFLVSRSFARND
jgi:ElaB/YqjD/DUF883 family membrane-anchored ribosome-binding protein